MADVSSGWGRLTWGQADWNDSSVYYTGWGARSWGDSSWGELNDITVTLTGVEATAFLGVDTWGYNAWGHGAWAAYAIEYAISELPTGVSATVSLGTVTETRSSTQTPTGVSSTASLGSLFQHSNTNWCKFNCFFRKSFNK